MRRILLLVLMWISANVAGSIRLVQEYPLTRIEAECACKAQRPEAFEAPVQFEFGAFAGQCVDSCRYRGAVPLKKNGSRQIVANLLHDDQYWTASIPTGAVSDVSIGFEEFLPRVYHVFLRFHFSKGSPVYLYKQSLNPIDGLKPSHVLHDVVISAEGVPAKGQAYNLMQSSMGNYLLVYRLTSVTGFSDLAIGKLGHKIKQYRVHLDAKARSEALKAGLQTSYAKSFNTVYGILWNNCATSALNLIAAGGALPTVAMDWVGLGQLERGLSIDYFYSSLSSLRRRGLIGDDRFSKLPNLEDEYAKRYKSSSALDSRAI